ncbi:kinase-like domain-containing protein, partial [Mycena leptocephala]
LLACRGSDAQSVLNLLQSLLDMDSTLPMRPLLFKALIRLSRASGLHPECLPLGIIPRLGQLVAGGGFGDIYKGVISEHVVAIKIIKVYDYSDKQAVLKAFGREALIWRQLSHPNLLPFLGIYHVEGRPCLVSPWMENGNVMQFLKIYRNFSEQQRLSFILDVALGLKYLHQNNVVHGDLKGVLNILVTPSARACIADFGLSSIAHATSQKFTHTTTDATQGGTARYLPPELISGDRKKHFVSDIYSFACVGYEILTGNVPFHQIREDVTVALKVLDGERPLRPALPSSTFPLDELWALFEGCWKDDPEIRPTAVEIVEQLVSRTRA